MMMLMTVARLGSCLLFAFLGVRGEALAGETMLYSEYISLIRQSANPYKYAIFYCGSRQNYIVDKLLSPEVNRHRLPVIFVAANDDVTSPISGRMVKGKDIWNLYHGAAGNIIFLNDQGHPIQGGFIPQIVHTNDPEIIRAHIEYIVAYGGRQPSISFQEYVRGIGLEDRFLEATQRYRHGFLGGMLSSAFPGTYVRGMTTDGNILDPWQGRGGLVVVISEKPFGRATTAMVRRLLALQSHLRYRCALIVPAGTNLRDVQRYYGSRGLEIGMADLEEIRRGVSPRTILTTGFPPEGSGQGMEFWGWFPMELLFARLKQAAPPEVLAQLPMDEDLPLGEFDAGQIPPMNIFNQQRSGNIFIREMD